MPDDDDDGDDDDGGKKEKLAATRRYIQASSAALLQQMKMFDYWHCFRFYDRPLILMVRVFLFVAKLNCYLCFMYAPHECAYECLCVCVCVCCVCDVSL